MRVSRGTQGNRTHLLELDKLNAEAFLGGARLLKFLCARRGRRRGGERERTVSERSAHSPCILLTGFESSLGSLLGLELLLEGRDGVEQLRLAQAEEGG